ncbi:MAG TPA: hypothetical protein VGD78_14225 [Chthoniobacterales bacterium]
MQVLSHKAAWLVRATASDGLHFVLASNDDALGIGKPNTLRAYSQFFKVPLGEAAGFLPPQLIPRATLSDNPFSGYTFTPDYSIYFVTSLYNYYLYTADRGFVREEWPAVEKEMPFLAGLSDPVTHLIPGGFGPAQDTSSNAH